MEQVKHTPGPWITHNGGVYSAKAKDEKLYAEMSVAACHTPEDARLIAAAPELLDVAQSILADDMVQYLPAEYVEKVRAAIAKATGG